MLPLKNSLFCLFSGVWQTIIHVEQNKQLRLPLKDWNNGNCRHQVEELHSNLHNVWMRQCLGFMFQMEGKKRWWSKAQLQSYSIHVENQSLKPIVLISFQQKALFVCNLFQTQTDLSNLVGNILLSIFSKNSLVLQSLNKLMHKKNWQTTIFFNFEHKKSRFADKAETNKYKYAWFIMINYSCLTIQ